MDQNKDNQISPPGPQATPVNDFVTSNVSQHNPEEPAPSPYPQSTSPSQPASISPAPMQPAPPPPPDFTPHPSPAFASPEATTPFTAAAVYSHAGVAPTKSDGHKRLFIGILLVILFLAAGGASAFYVTQKQPKSPEPSSTASSTTPPKEPEYKVPNGWEQLDTTLGFSIFAPEGWKLSSSSSSTINGLQAKTVTIGPELSYSSSDTSDATDSMNNSVTASSAKYLDKAGQAAYEEKVSKLSKEDAATLEGFGIKKEDIKTKAAHKDINGKNWLIVNTDIPNQFSTTAHFWSVDHAVTLTVISTTSAGRDKHLSEILYPVLASVTLK